MERRCTPISDTEMDLKGRELSGERDEERASGGRCKSRGQEEEKRRRQTADSSYGVTTYVVLPARIYLSRRGRRISTFTCHVGS